MKPKATLSSMLSFACPSLFLILAVSGCGPVGNNPQNAVQTQSQMEIVGGTEASRTDAVSKHTVVFVDPNGNIGCSGVVVGPHQVLSAGHCWGDNVWEDVHVAFTTRASDVTFGTPDANTRLVTKAIRHEGYNATFSDPKIPPFDIALVIFEGDLPAGYEPAPIFNTQLVIKAGTEVTLSGFGKNGESDESSRLLRSVTTVVGEQNLRKKEFYFGPTPGRGPCGGDSGGPAFIKSNGTLYLVGTTSRGTPDSDTCLDGKAIYTDVRFYQEWIEARGDFKMKVSAALTLN